MKQYWVSMIIQNEHDKRAWLCSMAESVFDTDEAEDLILKARKQFTVLSAWIDIFDELTSIARENFDVATSKDVYMEYVKKHGAEYIKTMTKYSRLSGGDFADQYQEGVYILRMANHLTVCKQGKIYDTWDCTSKMVYNAWLVR